MEWRLQTRARYRQDVVENMAIKALGNGTRTSKSLRRRKIETESVAVDSCEKGRYRIFKHVTMAQAYIAGDQ